MKAMYLFLLALVGLFCLNAAVFAQSSPKALKGQIITSSHEIQIPGTTKGFVKKMRKQDRNQFNQNQDGAWQIHFVAFFSRKLPTEQIGVVVLDAKNEPVALANVAGQKGQATLAAQILVDSTETPGKKHTLQVYFPKAGKPVILAKKQILLK